jgi:hypothetical protein
MRTPKFSGMGTPKIYGTGTRNPKISGTGTPKNFQFPTALVLYTYLLIKILVGTGSRRDFPVTLLPKVSDLGDFRRHQAEEEAEKNFQKPDFQKSPLLMMVPPFLLKKSRTGSRHFCDGFFRDFTRHFTF